MKRTFVMLVAGTHLRVDVRPVGVEAYDVEVEGQALVRVQRQAADHGSSRWSWQEGHRVRTARVDGGAAADLHVGVGGTDIAVNLIDPRKALLATLGLETRRTSDGPVHVRSPMPGRVVKILVAPGESVKEGQALLVVEAMKMENEMRAPKDGTVASLAVREGAAVEAGAELAVVE